MTPFPPPAEELRLLDLELRQLDARRAQLLHRRAWLVTALQAAPRPTAPAPVPSPRPEASPPRVQNVLLVLGGVLLTIAAMAFTLVSWGHLGIAGRALVLGAVTVAVLAAPVPLLRHGLRSTAEAMAGLGFALTVLDAYALHQVALADSDPLGFVAAASAALATLWAAYGLLPRTSELRLPLPAALVAAQLPLALWAVAAGASPSVITAAVLVTAGLDGGVALRAPAGSVRLTAAIGAYGLGAWGVWAAGWLSLTATGPSAAARAAALLLLAAGIALSAAWQGTAEKQAGGLAVTAGLLIAGALGGTARSVLPDAWTVPTYLACGIALLAAVRVERLPERVRTGFGRASAAVQGLAVLWTLPLVGIALLGPVGWAQRVWSGAPGGIREAVTVDVPWPPDAETVPVVLVVVAVGLLLSARRPWTLTGVLILAWATALVLPPVLEVPYAVGLMAFGLTTAGVLAAAAWIRLPERPASTEPAFPSPGPTATVLALLTSLPLVFLSLTTERATLGVLATLTALFAAASWKPHLAPVTAPAALAFAAALACATGAAAGWEPQHTALLVLAVPVAAALLAARLDQARATIPVEVTGALAALLAVGLAAATADLPMLALVLALCGVITAGTAARPDRRTVSYAAAALFVLATWVRLAAWDVGTPEAYTLPVSVPALLVGVLRRRRDPEASSWTAYGPGLAATLVPSLLAAWGDPQWTRPLLLGLAALAVTLVGARHHLKAPLLLGSTVLALDALHELAPYIAQVTDSLPRWVPPALAGLLLLAVGATYERRISDVRRVRDVLTRMD
ncbi:SCO7613 C-terminal domain-containing membrane protein [Streptomyces sp. NPDC098781]|uniref:SCO7613 C-terminal domain-containing membrane protein n=1 Tax=Streptomyces sp. NPDC098781 TaxID=3366097 RepID=UPI00380C7C6D